MARIQGLFLFPDALLAATEHLPNAEFGIYVKMLCRIWLFTETQYSFIDSTDNWCDLTGLKKPAEVKKIREKFSCGLRPFFHKKKFKSFSVMVQRGLLKTVEKTRKRSIQNSKNARIGWETRSSRLLNFKKNDDANASVSHSETHASNSNSNSNSKRSSFVSSQSLKREAKRSKAEVIGEGKIADAEKEVKTVVAYEKELRKYLSTSQIEQIKAVCELSEKYVQEKISLMLRKNRKNPSGFLYAALTQDYAPTEDEAESDSLELDLGVKNTKKPDIDRRLAKAKKQPLSEKEFNELPEELRSLLKEEEHILGEKDMYRLDSKPDDNTDAVTRVTFDNIEIGDKIEPYLYERLTEDFKKHFTFSPNGMKKIKLFHLLETK